jgi:hypothetical protein
MHGLCQEFERRNASSRRVAMDGELQVGGVAFAEKSQAASDPVSDFAGSNPIFK